MGGEWGPEQFSRDRGVGRHLMLHVGDQRNRRGQRFLCPVGREGRGDMRLVRSRGRSGNALLTAPHFRGQWEPCWPLAGTNGPHVVSREQAHI